MINASDFRNGVTIEMDNGIWTVVSFLHVKPGKGAAFVRTKLKNIVTGAVIERTFNPTDKMAKAHIETKEMQYLYNDGDLYYFMDLDTYDQLPLTKDQVEDAIRPGAVCEDVDKVARDFIEARYPGSFGHALGHGVGLDIHEQPRLGRGDGTVLRPGHVVTVEPGIYISGLGGCRIEDMAILTSDGYIDPIDAPKQLIEL